MSTVLTNNHDLPQSVYDAIKNDSYRGGGEISVTALIDSAQIRILKKQHRIEEDITERVWALLGSAVHNILERANIKSVKRRAFLAVIDDLQEKYKSLLPDDEKQADTINKVANWLFAYMQETFPELNERYLFEVRLFMTVDGMEISGQFDIYDKIDQILFDYKVTSVYSYIFPESRKKWDAQLNIYAQLLRNSGLPVKEAFIVAIFRDFSKARMLNELDYPKRQILAIPITLIEEEKVMAYIQNRVKIHRLAESGNVRECDGKDRWATATEYVVKAHGKKNAIPNTRTDNKSVAEEWIKENEHKYVGLYVETRHGESKRCNDYCSVREVCPQRKRMLDEANQSAL